MSYHRVLKVCMWLAIAIGAYSRFRGLGVWPLTTDEYFIVRSVQNILQHGIPAFDCGGYYMRGLTLQYLIVPLYWLGIHAELAARLVPVASSFAVLAAVYVLGKRLSGVTVACVSVALLSLSLWEIEFARFARMYMPFQAVFLWYLIALHRVVIDRDSRAYGWLWLLSVAGVLTWAGGLFLLAINLVPSLIERAPSRIRQVVVGAGFLVIGYAYSAWNFRFMGSVPPLPSDVTVDLSGGHVALPRLLVSTVPSHPGWMVGAVALAVVCLVAVWALARAPDVSIRERTAWIALVSLSFFNLFGFVVIGLVLALLLDWIDPRRLSRRSMSIAMPVVGAAFVFWFAYAALTTDWHQLFPGFGPGGGLSKLAVVLFKYPNVFDSIIFQWLAAIPISTIVLFGLTVLAGTWAVLAQDRERLRGLRLTLAAGLIMAILASLVITKHVGTRYTFFLLPLLYLMAATSVYELIIRPIRNRPGRGMAFGLLLLAMLGLTEDFGWAHMMHVDSMAWNYRLPLKYELAKHYYPRWDYRTTAQYVNRRAGPDDVIIITSTPLSYYLKRTDYTYRNFHDVEFVSIACDRGRRERWSNSRLLYREDDLFKIIDSAPGNVWIISNLFWRAPPDRILAPPYSAKMMYRGAEGNISVYKIDERR